MSYRCERGVSLKNICLSACLSVFVLRSVSVCDNTVTVKTAICFFSNRNFALPQKHANTCVYKLYICPYSELSITP